MPNPRRFRSIWVLLLFTILLGAGVLAWSLAVQSPREKAKERGRPTARVQIMARTPWLAFAPDERSYDEAETYRRQQKTQIQILKSRMVIESALRRPEIRQIERIRRMKDAVAWVQEHLEAEFFEDSEVLQVSLDDREVQEATVIVNGLVNCYLDYVVNRDQDAKKLRLAQLKQLRDTYLELVKAKRQEMRRRLAEHSNDALPIAVAGPIYENLRLQIIKLKTDAAETRTLLARRSASSKTSSESERAEIVRMKDRLAVLGAQQETITQELEATVAAASTSDELDLTELQEELKSYQEVLDKLKRDLDVHEVEFNAPSRFRLLDRAEAPAAESTQP